MKKISQILGMPIINKKSGKKVGKVKNVVYSRDKVKILAFLLHKGNIFKEASIIRYKNIYSIGKDAVIIEDDNVVECAKSVIKINSLKELDYSVIGEEIMTDEGESVGFVRDIVLDEKSGKILAYILTDGLVQDIVDGRNIIPCDEKIQFGEDALIINNEVRNNFEKYKTDYKKMLRL